MNDLLSLQQTAALLNISVKALQKYIENKLTKCIVYPSGIIMIKATELNMKLIKGKNIPGAKKNITDQIENILGSVEDNSIEKIVSAETLSPILDRSVMSIRRDIKKGLPCIVLPSGAVRFRLSAVEKWLDEHVIKTQEKRRKL